MLPWLQPVDSSLPHVEREVLLPFTLASAQGISLVSLHLLSGLLPHSHSRRRSSVPSMMIVDSGVGRDTWTRGRMAVGSIKRDLLFAGAAAARTRA